jgi:signal transduction histidine kinase
VPDLRDLELDKAVEDGLALVEGQVRQAGLTLETSLATPSPLVRADMAQLTQVVFNLVVNARTACLGKPGARIRVATRQVGPHAEIVVEDQGKGIPAEHLPRLFEPFFTTKDLWSNVGLGLSEAWRIVDEHGGDIQVRSEPGQGSTFTVRLPLAAGRTV